MSKDLQKNQQLHERIVAIFVGLAVSVLILLLWSSRALDWVEAETFDGMVQATAGLRPADDRIIVITIDDASLQELEPALGRWPWPRAVTAAMIEYCGEAAVIAVDILTPEADQQLSGSDDTYAAQVKTHGRVVTAVHMGPNSGQSRTPARQHLIPNIPAIGTYEAVNLPYEALANATAALGVTTQQVQPDGVMRRYQLTVASQRETLPSFALATAIVGTGNTITDIAATPSRVATGSLHANSNDGELILNPSIHPYQQVSAADVLAAWQDPEGSSLQRQDFRDKFVLIGSTATGLAPDHEVTSLGSLTPGVFINAVALDNILNNTGFRQAPKLLLIALVILMGLAPSLSSSTGPKHYTVLALGGSIFFILICLGCLAGFNFILPAGPPILALNGAAFCLGLRDWRGERLQRANLESLEVAKQQFTDMLVHDLKNRIGPITMALSSIERSETNALMIEGAEIAAKRLQNELLSLLEIRKITDNKMHVKRREMRLERMIRDLDHQFAAIASFLGLTLESDAQKLSSPAHIDPSIVDRIAGNLLWNAFDHTPSDGVVKLSCSEDEYGPMLIVSNPGRTLTAAEQKAALEPFQSSENTKRKTSSGTGLGLTFCNLATQAHGGSLTMNSPCPTSGEGVQVVIRLPKKQEIS